MTEDMDFAAPDHPSLVAVILHQHPRFGGDRFHPLVDSPHHRFPAAGVAAVRFDFVSEEVTAARAQAESAIEAAARQSPGVGVALAGYSFGAGVAAVVADARVRGWLLPAPQSEPLANSPLKTDLRPKLVVVPEFDQFGPPDLMRRAVGGWPETKWVRAPAPG